MEHNNERFLTLPNLLTLLALALALTAFALVLNGRFSLSFALALCAFMADFADGAVARKLHLESAIGKQLDILVDSLLYILYPAIALYISFHVQHPVLLTSLFLFIASGLYRLARFSVNGFLERQGNTAGAYQGLPVVFSHVLLLILFFVRTAPTLVFSTITAGGLLALSVLMTRSFPFPKPKKIAPFLLLLLFLATYFFWHGRNSF